MPFSRSTRFRVKHVTATSGSSASVCASTTRHMQGLALGQVGGGPGHPLRSRSGGTPSPYKQWHGQGGRISAKQNAVPGKKSIQKAVLGHCGAIFAKNAKVFSAQRRKVKLDLLGVGPRDPRGRSGPPPLWLVGERVQSRKGGLASHLKPRQPPYVEPWAHIEHHLFHFRQEAGDPLPWRGRGCEDPSNVGEMHGWWEGGGQPGQQGLQLPLEEGGWASSFGLALIHQNDPKMTHLSASVYLGERVCM